MAAPSNQRSPVAQAFGKTLRAAREEADLSQEELGLASDIDRTYVSLLERGLRQPTLGTLFALADQLGLTAEQLVERTRKELSVRR